MNSNGNGADFRAASGLPAWPVDGESPGLEVRSARLHRNEDGSWDSTATVRARPRPGSRLIWGSVLLLAALAGVAFYVSYAAQFGFVFAVKRLGSAAAAEALIPDAGMLICAALALAMAVQGRSARAARVTVVGFAVLSAVMNYEAAGSSSVHAVTVYVMPAVAFAVCTDLVVSVVRRFHYGVEDAPSPWAPAGRFAAGMARGCGLVALYGLRLVLAPRETPRGLRRMVLDAAPLPAVSVSSDTGPQVAVAAEPPAPLPAPDPAELPRPATKKARLISLYRQHPDYENEDRVSPVATELAGVVGMHPSNARKYLYEHVKDRLR